MITFHNILYNLHIYNIIEIEAHLKINLIIVNFSAAMNVLFTVKKIEN